MLTIKHLCKTYKTKNGVETKALDDVSLTLPETGMIFLLGKSGSGKSTLLNICGGLDTPDSGEIIVRGRSSIDFATSDFDSYRNTFVGFVFQEYNILNEFTVEENLSLALELQGKGKNKEKVDELLSQVDLTGFAKRKPNTLSGGQKQRIAIARALIKDPKIIMADEPTGALDSNTGKQVLDTLKKLSKDRLVIIVSHDREFAEIYGDRIIELKDGKVILDVTKERVEAKKINDKVSLISNNTLSIKNGSSLSDSEIAQVTEFIKNSSGDLIISNGEDNIKSFKKVNRIDDNDSSEKFDTTDVENIKTREYTSDESKFIKSKLPLHKAIRIGASSLKVKPIRLFFTIILSIAAFMLFGVFSTMMTYNKNTVLADSLSKSEYNGLIVNKYYNVKEKYYYDGKLQSEWDSNSSIYFTEEDMTEMQNEFGKDTLGIFNPNASRPSNLSSNSNYINIEIKGVSYADENSKYHMMKYGTYPTDTDEVAISEYYAQAIVSSTYYKYKDGKVETEKATFNNLYDVIGEYLVINGFNSSSEKQIYKITGIYDAGTIPSDYNEWYIEATTNGWEPTKYLNWNQYLNDSIQGLFLVSKDFIPNYIKENNWTPPSSTNEELNSKFFDRSRNFHVDKNTGWFSYYFEYYNVYDDSDSDNFSFYTFDDKTSLSKGEILLDLTEIYELYEGKMYSDDGSVNESTASTDFLNKYNTSENQEKRDLYYEEYQRYDKLTEEAYYDQQYMVEMEKYQKLIEETNQKAEEHIQEVNNTYNDYLTQATNYDSLSESKLNEADEYKNSSSGEDYDESIYQRYLDEANEYSAQADQLRNTAKNYMIEHNYGYDSVYSGYMNDIEEYQKKGEEAQQKYNQSYDPSSKLGNEYQAKRDYYQYLFNIYDTLTSSSSISLNSLISNVYQMISYSTTTSSYEGYKNLLTRDDKTFLNTLFKEILINTFDDSDLRLNYMTYETSNNMEEYFNATVVGYYIYNGSVNYSNSFTSCVFISNDDENVIQSRYRYVHETKFVDKGDGVYYSAFITIDDNSVINKVVNNSSKLKDDDTYFQINNSLSNSISNVNYMVESFKNIFLYVGIGLAVFAALLLFNFISVSISNKTHEIGVLRAIGARGWDVFKIFFAESAIITIICLFFSLIGSIILVTYLNSIISSALSFQYTLFVFGIFSVIMMLAEAIVVAFIGTFLPVFKVSRKKPVESMRTL